MLPSSFIISPITAAGCNPLILLIAFPSVCPASIHHQDVRKETHVWQYTRCDLGLLQNSLHTIITEAPDLTPVASIETVNGAGSAVYRSGIKGMRKRW